MPAAAGKRKRKNSDIGVAAGVAAISGNYARPNPARESRDSIPLDDSSTSSAESLSRAPQIPRTVGSRSAYQLISLTSMNYGRNFLGNLFPFPFPRGERERTRARAISTGSPRHGRETEAFVVTLQSAWCTRPSRFPV